MQIDPDRYIASGLEAAPTMTGYLRVGSCFVRVWLDDVYYAERLTEFFKGNVCLEPVRHGDSASAELYILSVRADDGLFLPDADDTRHPMRTELGNGGNRTIVTPLLRAIVELDRCPARVVVLVRKPWTTRWALRIHFIKTVPKVIFAFDRYYLHASAVVHNGRVSVFTGPNHSGKTSVALTLGKLGATIIADDHVLLSRAGQQFYVSGTDQFTRVCEKTERFLFDEPLAIEPKLHGRLIKKEIAVARYFVNDPFTEYPVDRLCLLGRGERAYLRALGKREALVRLLDLTGSEHLISSNRAEDCEEYLSYFADWIASTPTYELVLTNDLADLSRTAPRLLADDWP